MNKETKAVLMAVMVIAVFTFSPQTVKAEEMEGSHGTMMEEKADVAIHGFCPVCVINGMKVMGKESISSEYNGKTYYFASEDQKKMFLADPEQYVDDLDAKFAALKEGSMIKKDGHMMEGSH